MIREAVADGTFARPTDLRRSVGRRYQRPAADRATPNGTIGFHRAVNPEK